MLEIKVPVSVGELVDKVTILKIKDRRIGDSKKREHVSRELHLLSSVCTNFALDLDIELVQNLEQVNEKLWVVEDQIREKERLKEFDQDFIALARAVYRFNDQRFLLKKQVNELYGSAIVEEKSYQQYE